MQVMALHNNHQTYKSLLWVAMGSIVMFFAGLTSAFVVRKAEGNWTDIYWPDWFIYSTIVILLSSLLLIQVKRKIKQGEIQNHLIISSFCLGLIFAFFQILGWNELLIQGVSLVGFQSTPSSQYFFLLTFAHFAHLIGGIISLFVVMIKSLKGKYNIDNYIGIDLSIIYWHFLAILWLYLFIFIKYL